MIGRLNSCRQICVHNSRRGSESWKTSSPKNCPSALLEWGEVALQLWRSRKIASPHRIWTGTCLIPWSRGSWNVNVPCHICPFFTLQALWGKKWLHNSVLTLRSWTWLELDRRSNTRRTICVSRARIIFSASTRDSHTLPICMAATLHHAHSRPRTAIGLCIIPSEADDVPVRSSTSQFVSHQSSPERIYANEKFHSKAREEENGSTSRCLARHL